VSTFKQMRDRIAGDLRRSNLDTQIGNAINDAIAEAAKQRFYFNEMIGVSFPTVTGTEYYDDLGLTEIDAMYYLNGTTRYNLFERNQLDANDYADGNVQSGQLTDYARYGSKIRLYPIPTSVTTIYLDGYGKLTPTPLVLDGDSNAWLTEGELYIRALAKRNILRDVIRDYGEAKVLESVAEDYKAQLVEDTTLRSSTGTIRSTTF
jgi:hypothetical protein